MYYHCPWCDTVMLAGAQHDCAARKKAAGDVELFLAQFAAWLRTPTGRFAQFYAERQRRGAAA